MEDKISKIERLYKRYKQEPKKTILYAVIIIISLVGYWFFSAYVQEIGRQAALPKQKVELNDVFDELDQQKKATETPMVTRTFWLLREKGASISLGPCPSVKCFKIELGSLYQKNSLLFQKFILTGEGFSFFNKNVEKKVGDKIEGSFIFGIDDDFIIKNAPGEVSFSLKREVFIDIALVKGAEITVITRVYDIKFTVIDIMADSLKIMMEIGPSSGRDNSGINVE